MRGIENRLSPPTSSRFPPPPIRCRREMVQDFLSINRTITCEFGAIVIKVLKDEAIELVDCSFTRIAAPPDRMGEQLQCATVLDRVMCQRMAIVPFAARILNNKQCP